MKDYENNYGIRSIRTRIIIFALLVTLVPSLTMGWLLNNILQAALTEKTEQKLLDTSNVIEREISLWFKERYYDLHVFANSVVITEYLAAFNADSGSYFHDPSSSAPVKTYLKSLKEEFDYYRRLFVLGDDGTVIATSSDESTGESIKLPDDLESQIMSTSSFQGTVYVNDKDSPFMVIGVPLFDGPSHDRYSGFLAVEVNLDQLFDLITERLGAQSDNSTIQHSLTDVRTGTCLCSTNISDPDLSSTRISYGTIKRFEGSPHLKDFFDEKGVRVIGIISMLNNDRWKLVIAENYAAVFERSIQARKRNILITFCLTLVMVLSAYLFARRIIMPLQTLRGAAKQVAEGNLSVSLPVTYRDELGFTISVFNEMVYKLRLSQHKLEQLATMDSLTQLNNRKQIMQILKNQFDYFQRYRTTFCTLMVDVDHFKEVNDTYSHLAGDEVLRQLARIFDSLLRNVDSAGRFGGEEFLIVLAETDGTKGRQVAERIRKTIEERSIIYKKTKLSITVSIGIAEISAGDENEEKLVARADEALYKAKHGGRNQVVLYEE